MQNANLTLHCGANHVQREQVALVHTPEPTKTWHPIPHVTFIDQVEKALTALNMRVVEQAHSLACDGNRYFGLLQVANCQATGEDFTYVLGLRNSHDKSFPAGLVVGSQVFVCDNLSFSGEIRIARKHTVFIERDLPVLTGRAVGQLSARWTTMTERIARYKTTEIADRDAHDLVVRAMDVGACTVLQLPRILQEWRKPSHPEFAQGMTAWRLFNAFTEIAKSSGLENISRRTISLHALMDVQVGYAPVSAEQKIAAGTVDAEVIAAQN